jgi:NAD(P)H dehydrogenase (quinone)
MYAVMGVTGQVGGAVAGHLLKIGRRVRAIVRDKQKAARWKERGCELFVADASSARALTEAFWGTEGVFAMMPPLFDPSPGFSETRQFITSIEQAIRTAEPPKVVALSTIGAHLERPNLLTQLHILELALRAVAAPIAFLRPAWFMENASWDIEPAIQKGVVESYLQPLDTAIPMIAVQDVGQAAAELLLETWNGKVAVQIEGPKRITPLEIAQTLAELLSRDVRAEAVPRDLWERNFRSQGMKNPTPRIQMLDGFNEGWIEFQGGAPASTKTKTTLRESLQALVLAHARALIPSEVMESPAAPA